MNTATATPENPNATREDRGNSNPDTNVTSMTEEAGATPVDITVAAITQDPPITATGSANQTQRTFLTQTQQSTISTGNPPPNPPRSFKIRMSYHPTPTIRPN